MASCYCGGTGKGELVVGFMKGLFVVVVVGVTGAAAGIDYCYAGVTLFDGIAPVGAPPMNFNDVDEEAFVVAGALEVCPVGRAADTTDWEDGLAKGECEASYIMPLEQLLSAEVPAEFDGAELDKRNGLLFKVAAGFVRKGFVGAGFFGDS